MKRFLLLILLAATATGADQTGPVDLELRDLEGKVHKLSELSDQKAIVLAFLGVDCPVSKLYAGNLVELAKTWGNKGVTVLGIDPNRQDDIQELRAFANAQALPFPLLKDHGAAAADQLGVTRVPTVIVLDGARRVRYFGRIDDQYAVGTKSVGVRKDHAEVSYLGDAVASVVEGKEVATPRTEAVGCVLGREAPAAAAAVTYHEQVEPIIQRRCQGCHRPGQIAPFSLLTYDDAAGWDGMIAEVVENGRMPPWHADPAHGKFENDRSLSREEKELILAWARGGAPRGDPAKAPPALVFPKDDWVIGTPDLVFEMPKGFEVPARGTVKYQYFTVETGLKEDAWVQAIEVRPGARSVVHHILVFVADPKNPKAWQRESQGGTQGYFAAMVPGERPTVFPKGMAKKLPAGSTLVFQMHYTANGVAAEDRSRVGILLSKEKVQHEVKTRTAVQVNLNIPAGAERHEVTAQTFFMKPTTILSFLPHMHLRGAAFRYELCHPARGKLTRNPFSSELPQALLNRMRYSPADQILTWYGTMSDEAYQALAAEFAEPENRESLEKIRKEGRSETLLDVPAYDFGWQSSYVLATPRLVPGGTLLECTAAYNNSASNPVLTREMWSKRVRWGEQTWNEMMIGYFDCVAGDATGSSQGAGD